MPTMNLKSGIKISLFGPAIETIGLSLDVLHHLNIGIKTPEGLLTLNHFTIFLGFLINFMGILITLLSNRRK